MVENENTHLLTSMELGFKNIKQLRVCTYDVKSSMVNITVNI